MVSMGRFIDIGVVFSDSLYGGTWYVGSGQIVTESFDHKTADMNVDVTSIVEQWLNSTIPNNGFIVKFTSDEETNATYYGTLKFFSNDTNTIYRPRLVLKHDDSTYPTASTTVNGTLSANQNVVGIKGLKPSYNYQTIDKIRVLARERYPSHTFVITQSQYVNFNYLPTSSYYGVKDAYTGQMIVDFDSDYTKLSNDSSGNFFNFNFGTLFTGRLYKFVFKVVVGGLTQYYDNDVYFKVTR